MHLDAVPPIRIVINHVTTDKLTTAMAERLLRAQPVSANHVKERQSLIEPSELAEILLIYVYVFLYVRIKLMFDV